MKKTFINGIIIFIVISLIWVISTINNKINPPYVFAYDPNYGVSFCVGSPYKTSPNIINDMDGSHACLMRTSPIGSEADARSWKGGANPGTIPTPSALEFSGEDINSATGYHGSDYMRVIWSGNNLSSGQFIHLTNYANVTKSYGKLFENCGCGGLTITPAGGYDAMVTAGNNTITAGDWGCYSYLRFYMYLNFQANDGSATGVSQRAALYDGNITVSAGAVTTDIQSVIVSENFMNHYSISLNALANHYDTVSGRYFSVSNIADIIIYAPETDYSLWNTPAPFPTPGWTSLISYYDNISLGARADTPYYDSPSNITIQTAYSGVNPIGAFVSWDPQLNATPEVPVTAYHVYRKLATGTTPDAANPFEPYVSVGIIKATDPLCITDTAILGGNTYCYKILTCNNGPVDNSPAEERGRTVNANFNEPLLNDTTSQVGRVCGYINPMPTKTMTPTISPTVCFSNCGTATPTYTITPLPTKVNLDDAHVYPNPYNPNATPGPSNLTGGSGKFYVDNTPDGTKINIFAMDGALVKEGTFKSVTGRFTWDGKNKNGSKVVSGLYYLVLEAPDKKTRVFRIIVCYKCDPVYHP